MRIDKYGFAWYPNRTERVAETCEARNLKKLPSGGFLFYKEEF